MAKYLCKVVTQYRVDSDAECERYLAEAKENNMYEVIKSVTTKKETKDDEYYILEIHKRFNDPKYATDEVEVVFEKE